MPKAIHELLPLKLKPKWGRSDRQPKALCERQGDTVDDVHFLMARVCSKADSLVT